VNLVVAIPTVAIGDEARTWLHLAAAPSSSLLIIMASLHELRDMPIEGDYFLSFDDFLEVIRDASVKHKFSFKVPHKDTNRARYRCTNKACPWVVNAHLN
jgi:hypothetical protein